MTCNRTLLAGLMCLVLAWAGAAHAEPPEKMRLQGTITQLNGQPVIDGNYAFRVKLYVNAGDLVSQAVLTMTANSQVVGGAYSLILTPDTPGDLAAALETARFVEITVVDDGSQTFDETLTPRQEITSVPFALNAQSALPRGVIVMWSGDPSAVPEGWALCDGTNGTPDLSGRFVVGYDASDPDYDGTDPIGAPETGGLATVALDLLEMPAHDHGGGDHRHTLKEKEVAAGGKSVLAAGDDPAGYTKYSGNIVDMQGSGQPHENRPPYYVLAYIMKL